MSMEEQIPVSLSYWQDVRKRFFGNKISIVGLVVVLYICPAPPDAITVTFDNIFSISLVFVFSA